MKRPVLEAVNREKLGKNNAYRSRISGYVPAVVYYGTQNKHVNVDQLQTLDAIRSHGDSALVELRMGGNVTTALIKEVQRDPVSGELLHIDFKPIEVDKVVHTKVPISFTGTDMINRQGGVMQTQRHEVEIECKAEDVPKAVNIDVSKQVIGGSLKLGDIEVGAEISILGNPEDIIATFTGSKGPEVPDVENEIDTKA